MADPIRLQIRKAIQAALQTIPGMQASSVFRDPVNLLTLPSPMLPAIRMGYMEPLHRVFQPALQIKEDVVITLTGLLEAPNNSDGEKDDAAEQFLAAIEAALSPDPSFGGLVTDLRVRQPAVSMTGLDDQNRIAVEQAIQFTFHRVYGAP